MDDMTPFEERLASRLRADAARGAPSVSSLTMADGALRVAGRRSPFGFANLWTPATRRMVIAGVTAGLLVVGLLAAWLIGSRPQRSFPANLIAYTDATTESVWAMPRSGGAAKLVIQSNWRGPLTWSPDGRWLATPTVDQRILLVRPDGTEARVIGRGHDIHWSRDGRRIALIAPTLAGGEATIHDVASGQETRLPIPAGFDSIQLVGWLGDDVHVLIRACAGCGTGAAHRYGWFTLPGEERPTLPTNARPGALSPDGWKMAWSPCESFDNVSSCLGLFVTDLRTGSTRQIADPSAIAYDPISWAPDGTSVVYPGGTVEDFGSAAGAVWRVRLDGSAPVEMLGHPAESVVSPDGSEIAFVRVDEEPNRSLALLSADGTRTTELVQGPNVGEVAWQPSQPGADSPEAPAADPTVRTCDVGRPVFGRDGCLQVEPSDAIVPLDVDPKVDPINLLDLNLLPNGRTGFGLADLTGIHGAVVVALAAGERCDVDLIPESRSTPAAGTPDGQSERRWCVRTKAGTVVELSLMGYDLDYGTLLAYQRRS